MIKWKKHCKKILYHSNIERNKKNCQLKLGILLLIISNVIKLKFKCFLKNLQNISYWTIETWPINYRSVVYLYISFNLCKCLKRGFKILKYNCYIVIIIFFIYLNINFIRLMYVIGTTMRRQSIKRELYFETHNIKVIFSFSSHSNVRMFYL